MDSKPSFTGPSKSKNQGHPKISRRDLEASIPAPFDSEYEGPEPLPSKDQSHFELRRYHGQAPPQTEEEREREERKQKKK
jgi:hypothetical protein